MKKVTIVLFVVLLALTVGAYFYLDRVVESVIERSSARALGVETNVETATLNPWTGRLGMNLFTAQNPSGMAAAEAHFASLQEGRVEMPFASLWRDTVNVPEVSLSGLVINLEQEGLSSNYQTVLRHVGEYLAAANPEAAPVLIVDDMRIRNITVNLSVSAASADVANLQTTIPGLHVQNVGAEEGGVSPAHLTTLVITTVLQAMAESEQALPNVIREILLARLEGLPRPPVQVEGEVAWSGTEDAHAQIGSALRQRAEDVLEEGKDVRDHVLDRARAVFGRDTTK